MHRLAGLFAAFVILWGAAFSPAAAEDKTLTVFAAASMKNALDDIDAAFTAKTGVKVSASYAASSTLAKQIEQGAPADIFVSADTDWMDYAISKKNINEPTRVNLLGNSIVLIAPKDSKIDNVTIGQGFDLAKLAGDGKIATGDVKSVPVGKYAKAALEKLGAWQAAEPKFAMAESVRAALTLVARGEAVLGIVYSTDAKVEPGVKIVGTFPADSHPPIIYPVAATSTAKPEVQGISRLSAFAGGEGGAGEIRLQLSDQADVLRSNRTEVFDITPTEWTAILLSIRVATVATLVATPLGIALAYLLARRDFWGKSLLDALVHLPLVLPPVVTGYLAAARLRSPRPDRRIARRPSRHRVRVPLDRRRARLRRDVVSAAGAPDPAVDRGG